MFLDSTNDTLSQEMLSLYLEKSSILETDLPQYAEQLKSILKSTGKSIRARILFALSGPKIKEAGFYAACIELVHLASLIQDDVIDEATTRRGKPAFFSLTGKRNAILTGDFLSIKVLYALEQKGGMPIMREFLSGMKDLIEGEIAQNISMSDTALSEKAYVRSVEKKTGSLFRIAAASGAILSGVSDSSVTCARRFGSHFGIAFQIMDDVRDLATSKSGSQDKTPFSDLKNNVMTLPIIHFIGQGGDYNQLQALVGKNRFAEAVALLDRFGSIEYAKKKAEEEFSLAQTELQTHFSSETVERIAEEIEHLWQV